MKRQEATCLHATGLLYLLYLAADFLRLSSSEELEESDSESDSSSEVVSSSSSSSLLEPPAAQNLEVCGRQKAHLSWCSSDLSPSVSRYLRAKTTLPLVRPGTIETGKMSVWSCFAKGVCEIFDPRSALKRLIVRGEGHTSEQTLLPECRSSGQRAFSCLHFWRFQFLCSSFRRSAARSKLVGITNSDEPTIIADFRWQVSPQNLANDGCRSYSNGGFEWRQM